MDVDGYTMWITGGSLVLITPQVSELERCYALGSLRDAQRVADQAICLLYTSPSPRDS